MRIPEGWLRQFCDPPIDTRALVAVCAPAPVAPATRSADGKRTVSSESKGAPVPAGRKTSVWSSTGLQRPLSEPLLVATQLWAGQGAQRAQVRAGPTVDEYRVAGADIAGEGALEERMEPACGQPAVEGRVDEPGEVFWIEDLTRHWNRRRSGNELGRRELALRVAANRSEDFLALLLESVRESICIES